MASKEKIIRKGKLSEIVVERLNSRIRSGELKAGERIPTERALAEDMGVSRTVIREAIRIMVDRNVLELRNGCGYVRQLSFGEILDNISGNIVLDETSMLEIMEVRAVLENYIVGKAAENILPGQVEELQDSINKMRLLMEEGQYGFMEEETFHRGLVDAAGNNTMKSIYRLCEGLLSGTLRETWRVAEALGAHNTAVDDHQAILDAVKAGNAEDAEKRMKAHMDYARDNLKRYYAEKNT